MQTTINLLEKALKIQPFPTWTKKLGLSMNALSTSKINGHLSPPIAGALAEELGEDVEKWIIIAALESARDSACKDRMMKKFASSNDWRKR